MKVSFDFDGTLTMRSVQAFCALLIARNYDVWITTFRYDDEHLLYRKAQGLPRLYENDALYRISDALTIPRQHIIFTNHTPKLPFLLQHDFAFHLDDDPFMIAEIATVLPHIVVNVLAADWQKQCLLRLH
jgi:hypothetical protein